MMKKALLITGLFLCLPFVLIAADSNYIIGESDSLDISIWGEQTLSRQVNVRPDGLISIPLIGEVKADGKTPVELQIEIQQALSKFIKDPKCVVIVLEPKSKQVYVDGQVINPGQFILDKDIYFSQIISLAGGFTEWASKGSIIILRTEGDKRVPIKADYNKIVKGKKPDIKLMPGDTIVVP
jgi:polysaccharide export outer membrane protein